MSSRLQTSISLSKSKDNGVTKASAAAAATDFRASPFTRFSVLVQSPRQSSRVAAPALSPSKSGRSDAGNDDSSIGGGSHTGSRSGARKSIKAKPQNDSLLSIFSLEQELTSDSRTPTSTMPKKSVATTKRTLKSFASSSLEQLDNEVIESTERRAKLETKLKSPQPIAGRSTAPRKSDSTPSNKTVTFKKATPTSLPLDSAKSLKRNDLDTKPSPLIHSSPPASHRKVPPPKRGATARLDLGHGPVLGSKYKTSPSDGLSMLQKPATLESTTTTTTTSPLPLPQRKRKRAVLQSVEPSMLSQGQASDLPAESPTGKKDKWSNKEAPREEHALSSSMQRVEQQQPRTKAPLAPIAVAARPAKRRKLGKAQDTMSVLLTQCQPGEADYQRKFQVQDDDDGVDALNRKLMSPGRLKSTMDQIQHQAMQAAKEQLQQGRARRKGSGNDHDKDADDNEVSDFDVVTAHQMAHKIMGDVRRTLRTTPLPTARYKSPSGGPVDRATTAALIQTRQAQLQKTAAKLNELHSRTELYEQQLEAEQERNQQLTQRYQHELARAVQPHSQHVGLLSRCQKMGSTKGGSSSSSNSTVVDSSFPQPPQPKSFADAPKGSLPKVYATWTASEDFSLLEPK